MKFTRIDGSKVTEQGYLDSLKNLWHREALQQNLFYYCKLIPQYMGQKKDGVSVYECPPLKFTYTYNMGIDAVRTYYRGREVLRAGNIISIDWLDEFPWQVVCPLIDSLEASRNEYERVGNILKNYQKTVLCGAG